MKKGKAWFDNLSLYKKILLIISVSLLCICFVFFANIRYLAGYYEEELYEIHAQSLKHISTTIAAEMQAVEAISNNLIGDSVIENNLFELKTTEEESVAKLKRNIYQALYAYTFYNDYVKSIHILLQDGSNICMGNTDDIQVFQMAELETEAERNRGKLEWAASVDAGSSVVCYRQFCQRKYLTFEKLADVYIVVDMGSLIRDALENSGYRAEDSNFILLEEGKRIYPSEACFDEQYPEIFQSMKSEEKAYCIARVGEKEKFVIEGEIPDTDWQYLFFRDYEKIFRNMQTAGARILCFTVFAAALMLLALLVVFRRILKHLDYLVEKIQRFGEKGVISENFSGYDYEKRQDEIGQLHRSFDQMTRNVKTLRDQNYEKQLLLQEAQIRMLQQQINPHFLYNTLDTINWMAQKYGVDEISVMAKSLGNLFRASINGKSDLITLTEELEVLNNYVQIQKIRFRDRLKFEMDLPETDSQILVPKLCIQPLVENALKHSMEYHDGLCCISVKIRMEGRICTIKVSNTGSRFAEDLLYRIEHGQVVSQGSGVGLTNINARLKLLYGEAYGLRFYNDDEWAVVVLNIPQKRSEDNAETDDCRR
ncbi:MAG: sensor histidine kinase [Candidatus Limivivens sp.]|nr:sensor histidine kinase [Candidatus Limivivens sp.]